MSSTSHILSTGESLAPFLDSLVADQMCPPHGPNAINVVASALRVGAYGVYAAVVCDGSENPWYARDGVQYTASFATHGWDRPEKDDEDLYVYDRVGSRGSVVRDDDRREFRVRLPKEAGERDGLLVSPIPFGHDETLAAVLKYNRRDLE